MSVPGVQQSGSIYILQILFPYRLLQNTVYSSMCYTVGPYCSSILHIIACAF